MVLDGGTGCGDRGKGWGEVLEWAQVALRSVNSLVHVLVLDSICRKKGRGAGIRDCGMF